MSLFHVYSILFVLLVLEGIGIPGIPFEAAFIAAGYYIGTGEMPFLTAVAIGSLGNLLGNMIGYWLGAGFLPIILRKTRHSKISAKGQEIALYWFERYGAAVVVISRWFGLIRTPTIICAHTMGMKPLPYLFYSAIGAFSWTLVWQYGSWKGVNLVLAWWHLYRRHAGLGLNLLLIGLFVLLVAAVGFYFFWRKRKLQSRP